MTVSRWYSRGGFVLSGLGMLLALGGTLPQVGGASAGCTQCGSKNEDRVHDACIYTYSGIPTCVWSVFLSDSCYWPPLSYVQINGVPVNPYSPSCNILGWPEIFPNCATDHSGPIGPCDRG